MTTEEKPILSQSTKQENLLVKTALLKPATDSSISRSAKGRFVEGASGNPKGRPLSTRNQITNLKQNLEIALRENVKVDQIRGIITKMADMAIEGNVGAAKLILDKVLSNAKVEEDSESGDTSITIHVKNATFGSSDSEETIIDVTPTEELDMSTGAKAENQSGPASGGASGAAGTPNAPARTPAKSGGGTGAAVAPECPPSDGLGGTK